MALTATATTNTRKLILQSLAMTRNCHVIVKSPDQVNITYEVVDSDTASMSCFINPLVRDLLEKGTTTEKPSSTAVLILTSFVYTNSWLLA